MADPRDRRTRLAAAILLFERRRQQRKRDAEDLEDECDPFQFALSTRAGTECVSHMIRATMELDPELTVLFIDEMGAYCDALLPFVRMSYEQPSRYWWRDEESQKHVVSKEEGGEQEDPLMPVFFTLELHNTLVKVKAQMLL